MEKEKREKSNRNSRGEALKLKMRASERYGNQVRKKMHGSDELKPARSEKHK